MTHFILLFCALASASDAWKDAPSDVIAERDIAKPPAELYQVLLDLNTVSQLIPEDCADKWAFGAETTGERATARVTWKWGWLKRRLTMEFGELTPDRAVELDHPDKNGFTSQFRLDATETGTKVVYGTYLDTPPWPFRKYYLFKIRPTWEDCHGRTLDNLAAQVE